MQISHSISKWRFSCSLTGHQGPPNYVDYNIEFRVVLIFWALEYVTNFFLKHLFLEFVLKAKINNDATQI